jgi:DNA-binding transcriptional MerR regulator
MANYLMIRAEDEERIFTRNVAVQLARITREFLMECEREELIEPRPMMAGGEGYTWSDIEEIARMHRLRQDLGLDLGAVEVVLRMRHRILEMLDEVERLEEQLVRREERLHREIRRLRQQVAQDADIR